MWWPKVWEMIHLIPTCSPKSHTLRIFENKATVATVQLQVSLCTSLSASFCTGHCRQTVHRKQQDQKLIYANLTVIQRPYCTLEDCGFWCLPWAFFLLRLKWCEIFDTRHIARSLPDCADGPCRDHECNMICMIYIMSFLLTFDHL